MRRRRRIIRDTDDEPQEQEEEEKSNDSLIGSIGPTGKTGGGGRERVRRWDYMNPFSGSDFGLAPEDWLREFDQMRHEMEHVFEETIQDMERIPKELVREYQTTAAGEMAREIGTLVYGYSYTVGADGKPQFREFGNIRPSQRSLGGRRPGVRTPMLTAEREPLADVATTDKEVKVTVEMPGITKQDIKVSAYEGAVEVSRESKEEISSNHKLTIRN
jgi:HSP20 family molecular chaperone IbpA